ncbi:MAG: outer membrane protein assembly factor BamB family protein [Ktedonobacterales bacterium]
MSDNAELWRQPPHECGYVTQSLLVNNGVLYYMTRGGGFTAFRTTDGSVLWSHSGYSRGGEFTHWDDTFTVATSSPGVVFIHYIHASTCGLFGGCDPNYARSCQFFIVDCSPDIGNFLEAVNPATGSLYWRYRLDGITNFVFDSGS